MGKHKGNVGHCVHHRIEYITSIVGPTYKCMMCGKWYDSCIKFRSGAGIMRYCLDCAEKIRLIERVERHLKEEGLNEFHW